MYTPGSGVYFYAPPPVNFEQSMRGQRQPSKTPHSERGGGGEGPKISISELITTPHLCSIPPACIKYLAY